MKIFTGSYTGNGTVQSIIGTGFTPDMVLVKSTGGNSAQFRTFSMQTGSLSFRDNSTTDAGAIKSLDGNGFSVGASNNANTSGVTYYYAAFKNMNSGAMATGAWNGTALAFTANLPVNQIPKMIMGKTSSTQTGIMRTDKNSANTSMNFYGGAGMTNDLLSFGIGTVSVGIGGEANQAASLFSYFALFPSPVVNTGTYTGNGTGQIVTTGNRPDVIFIGNESGIAATLLYVSSMPTGNSTAFDGTAMESGIVTGITTNSFTVNGTSARANQAAATYFWVTITAQNVGRTPIAVARVVGP